MANSASSYADKGGIFWDQDFDATTLTDIPWQDWDFDNNASHPQQDHSVYTQTYLGADYQMSFNESAMLQLPNGAYVPRPEFPTLEAEDDIYALYFEVATITEAPASTPIPGFDQTLQEPRTLRQRRKLSDSSVELSESARQHREVANHSLPNKKPCMKMLASHQLNVLTEWLSKHLENPYPSIEEKHELAKRSELSVAQVSSWMSRSRKVLHEKKHLPKNPHNQNHIGNSEQQRHKPPSDKQLNEPSMAIWRRLRNLYHLEALPAANEAKAVRITQVTHRQGTRQRSTSLFTDRKPTLASLLKRSQRARTSNSISHNDSLKLKHRGCSLNSSFAVNVATCMSNTNRTKPYAELNIVSIPPGGRPLLRANVDKLGRRKFGIENWLTSLPEEVSKFHNMQQAFMRSYFLRIQDYVDLFWLQQDHCTRLWCDDLKEDGFISSEMIWYTAMFRQHCPTIKSVPSEVWLRQLEVVGHLGHSNVSVMPKTQEIEISLIDCMVDISLQACPICQSLLRLRCNIDFHLVEHGGGKRFVCPCLECFQSLDQLTEHIKDLHPSSPWFDIHPQLDHLDPLPSWLFNQWFTRQDVTVSSFRIALAWPSPKVLRHWRGTTRLLHIPPLTFGEQDGFHIGEQLNTDFTDNMIPGLDDLNDNDQWKFSSDRSDGSVTLSNDSIVYSHSSASSHTSLGPRKGRRLPFAKSNRLRSPAEGNDFRCTFEHCEERFKRLFTWRRHEDSIHAPEYVYICGPPPGTAAAARPLDSQSMDSHPESLSEANDLERCVMCLTNCDTSPRVGPSARRCWQKPVSERTFYRRDAFAQHLRVMHCHASRELDLTAWMHRVDMSQYPGRFCNFCYVEFKLWNHRYSHMGAHFKNGDRMQFQNVATRPCVQLRD